MVKISEEKINTIKSSILSHLFSIFPSALFTAEIAKSQARDEEFIKSLMIDLKDKSLVTSIRQNPQGVFYSKRIRWRLSSKAHEAYKQQV